MNIALILEMAVDAAPDRVGLVCDNQRWTYSRLLAAARGAADAIRKSGVRHVALLDESSEAAAIALFGAALAGVPYCPLNYRLADTDLAALIERITPALIIGDVERLKQLAPGAGHVGLSRSAFVELAEASGVDAPSQGDEGGDNVAIQLFTSGTTAAPKAAILRHANLLSYILGTVEFGAADDGDAALVSVPPYHIAGISALLSSIYALRTILMLPAFEPEAWIKLAQTEGATNAFVVPTMLSRIIDKLETQGGDLSMLRAIAYGGGKMPLEVIARALDLFPEAGFTNAYGLTETSSTIALLGPEEHRAAHRSEDAAARERLASVGRPLSTVEIEIRGEDGQVLPAGERGEIYVRGDQVSGEYKERSALVADGWFPTRDAGWLDEDGYLFLAGRADDVIVRGGENMSPGEIEDVLMTLPAVADACAVAMPSLEWGEAVGVAIVPREGHARPDIAAVKELIRARLRSSRVPEQILFVDALPYNEMGKLLRREVKKLFAD